jgi:outer membrane protein assembly factor BamB
MKLPGPTWSSPTIVDDMLVMGDCSGRVLGLDLSDPNVEPVKVWEVATGACVESSAAIWRGTVYMGSRDGYLYALRDPD